MDKTGLHLFSVSVDLTRRRYLLQNKAKKLIKDSESINYVFADINCSLGMKFQNGVFKYDLHCLIRYFRYKMITSQNVSFETQVKNFLFRGKVMFRSQDMQVFGFLTIQ